jgi:hypothetical protein
LFFRRFPSSFFLSFFLNIKKKKNLPNIPSQAAIKNNLEEDEKAGAASGA